MKKLAFLGGAAGIAACFALLGSPLSEAADHEDAPDATANHMADINDLYAWMTTDTNKLNLALTVSPFDDGQSTFSSDVTYVFHVTSRPGFLAAGSESRLICKLASNTDGECWVVNASGATLDYVKGNFSTGTGVASASGKVRVFAGQRSDPFFFNEGGFKRAIGYAFTQCGPGSCPGGSVGANAAGCLKITPTQAVTIRTLLQTAPPADIGHCQANQKDCFADANVMAIVAQVDKDLVLNGSNTLLSVWASTHAAP